MKLKTPAPVLPIHWSHPARGAWIEMLGGDGKMTASAVAPRKGCVD